MTHLIDSIGMVMANFLGLPILAAEGSKSVDVLNGWVHWLMLILFVGWGAFLIYTLIKFSNRNNPKADYNGIKGKFSKYLEGGVILAEVFLLFALAIPGWANLKANIPDTNSETLEIRVIAQQFAWNIHYPGEDGEFGKTFAYLVDESDNPIGLDREGPGLDDIVTLNQLYLQKGKLVKIRLTSKDVIHSFALPEMRVKQDAIPGMEIPIFFTPTMSSDEFEVECNREFLSQGKEYRYGEIFTDNNNNGRYDKPEEFIDSNDNGKYDKAEEFTDLNDNGIYDKNEPYKDFNKNKIYDHKEEFIDSNDNKRYDYGESFVDKPNGEYDDGEKYQDLNHNGIFDEGEPYRDFGDGIWNPPRGYEIVCAQLCGLGHYRMAGYMTILEADEFNLWYENKMNEQREAAEEEEEW